MVAPFHRLLDGKHDEFSQHAPLLMRQIAVVCVLRLFGTGKRFRGVITLLLFEDSRNFHVGFGVERTGDDFYSEILKLSDSILNFFV